MAGSPGRDASSGGVYYYNPLGTPTSTFNTTSSNGGRQLTVYNPSIGVDFDPSLLGQAALVNASNGDSIPGIDIPPNVPDNKFSYFG